MYVGLTTEAVENLRKSDRLKDWAEYKKEWRVEVTVVALISAVPVCFSLPSNRAVVDEQQPADANVNRRTRILNTSSRAHRLYF